MYQFNPDGSVKLPEHLAKKKQQEQSKLQSQRAIQIEKEITSAYAPKQCKLRITLSNAINDSRFIKTIFDRVNNQAATPLKLKQISEKEYEIIVETDFRRCSDCTKLINQYREFLYGNIIEKKGTCTFQTQKQNFCYEDYFD
jgi:hypothetical protein